MSPEQINVITAQALNQSTTMGSIVQQLIGIIQQQSNEIAQLKQPSVSTKDLSAE